MQQHFIISTAEDTFTFNGLLETVTFFHRLPNAYSTNLKYVFYESNSLVVVIITTLCERIKALSPISTNGMIIDFILGTVWFLEIFRSSMHNFFIKAM